MQLCRNLTHNIFDILKRHNVRKGAQYTPSDVHYGLATVVGTDIIMVEPLHDTSRSIIVFDNGNVEAVIGNKTIKQQILVEVILDILELDRHQ